ncbi:PAS domain S-box-containing protein [Variovorax sp. OV329]|nr:PAS domain S-box-containing protein [Variovorax sp. OV329]
MRKALADHLAGRKERFGAEARIGRDSSIRWVQLAGIVARDASGKPLLWTGTVRDITERKSPEAALGESEQRYELAMAASESGNWDRDVPTTRQRERVPVAANGRASHPRLSSPRETNLESP